MNTLQSIHKLLFSGLSVEHKEQLGELRRYRPWGQRGCGTPLIAMVDGTTFHGGLCDRWKGIVSLYAWCKATGRDFRIHYTWPFRLEQFQVPAQYDWHIATEDICRRLGRVKLMRLTGDATLNRMRDVPTEKQIHAYANRDWIELINRTYGTSYRWGELFLELFRPTSWVEQQVSSFPQSRTYIGVAFRMQNLLGDYREYSYQPIEPRRQKELLEQCRTYIEQLHNTEQSPILVTSDSKRLIEALRDLPYISATSLQGVHPDTDDRAAKEAYGKAFVDFYALAGARKIYAPIWEGMYASDFPYYASLLGGIPFERVRS